MPNILTVVLVAVCCCELFHRDSVDIRFLDRTALLFFALQQIDYNVLVFLTQAVRTGLPLFLFHFSLRIVRLFQTKVVSLNPLVDTTLLLETL